MIKVINSQTITNTNTFSIALVVSQFNQDITTQLKEGALRRLKQLNFNDNEIVVVEVPGAVEIPLVAKRLAISKKYEAIIALGAVIRGETSHYDYVCDQVSIGCQQVMLSENIPVIFGVLTTDNEEQAWDRLGGKHGHKGEEAVDCAVDMYKVLTNL